MARSTNSGTALLALLFGKGHEQYCGTIIAMDDYCGVPTLALPSYLSDWQGWMGFEGTGPITTTGMMRRGDILVVDDDVATTDFIGEVLFEEGYTARLANTTSEAIAAVTERTPDLILLDFLMPGDNRTLLCYLRHKGVYAVPTIVMSAAPNVPTDIMLKATDILRKPFTLDALLECVTRYVVKPLQERSAGT